MGGARVAAPRLSPASLVVAHWPRGLTRDTLQPALAALAERRADLAEEDHRRVHEASLRSGESLRMRFRCEPSLPVDVIGLIVLLPAPVL